VKRLRITGVLVAVLVIGAESGAEAQTAKDVVAKATEYAHEFIARFSNVVAEERYEQQITVPGRKRILVSDFLLVRFSKDAVWQAFRDVAEVDGKPVRDREDRMMKLFLEPSPSALRRAEEIAGASAQYNLSNIGTLNNPLVAMAFLQRHYVDRFQLDLGSLEKNLGPNVRTLRFDELRKPTLLKRDGHSDLFSRGVIWLEADTGRVIKTELQVGSPRAPILVTTTYKFDEELGINVPIVMEDRYPLRAGEFRGRATYGKFRRFKVQTDETIAK
jgi:hypothetical protein